MAKKHAEPESGSEGWLVSYCDMISLLVTFFLMMMTFSTASKGDVKSVGVGILKGRGGVFPNLTGYPAGSAPEEKILADIADAIDGERHSGGLEDALALSPQLDGLALQFGEDCSFAPGSAEITPALRARLESVGKAVQTFTHLIVVEGHTDDRFKSTPEFPDAEALSAARAVAAARILIEFGRVPPELLQIAGRGAERPRRPNDSALDRTWNRRVEVRLISLAARESSVNFTPGR
ncbi:MAG TPA: OmpA family protein [Planctomycetota bacterium]|nr:OmpA family protein [Planctomycetota bacterium]